MTDNFSLTVNGAERPVDGAQPDESLLYVLRERLGLPGSKAGCEQGECGSCSVLVDGALVCACLVLAAAAVGTDIVTVEGLGTAEGLGAVGALDHVQRAFVDTGAVQCGFCTPGLVMAVHDLLAHDPAPSDAAVREAISGNLCRCTGYGRILEAVQVAASAQVAAG